MFIKKALTITSFCLCLSCSEEDTGPISEFNRTGFFTSNDGTRLSFVIDYPGNGSDYPAIVFGHGSGPKSKGDSKGFAERLLERGFTVLRYDKRGVGDSEGEHICSCSDEVNGFLLQLAEDMMAAAELLNSDPRVDTTQIGLMGVSQAGWTISAAARSHPVDFFIVLSGPTVPLTQVSQFENLAQESDLDLSSIAARVDGVTGGFDPQIDLAAGDVPGLWIFGDSDRNIPVDNCTKFLDQLIAEEEKAYTYEVLENADHALRDTRSGKGIDYWPKLFDWYESQVRS